MTTLIKRTVPLMDTDVLGNAYYTGPLYPAIALVEKDYWTKVLVKFGATHVFLCDGVEGHPKHWGIHDNPDMAWRYAVGIIIGRLIEDLGEEAARTALRTIVQEWDAAL